MSESVDIVKLCQRVEGLMRPSLLYISLLTYYNTEKLEMTNFRLMCETHCMYAV